jgi:hypothetical protein
VVNDPLDLVFRRRFLHRNNHKKAAAPANGSWLVANSSRLAARCIRFSFYDLAKLAN